MGFWKRWLGRTASTDGTTALYAAVVAIARDPNWYLTGGVPDTMDGRCDMVATILAFVILRLETDAGAAAASAQLTERFVTDMDGQLREIGIGDVVVGKHIGRMMGMLGGRLGAYRDGLANGDLRPALLRNLYRGESPATGALDFAAKRLTDLQATLGRAKLDALLAGRLS